MNVLALLNGCMPKLPPSKHLNNTLNHNLPPPPYPTKYPPGSEGKIDVMAWRYSNGYHIHHPDDYRPPPSLE